MKHSYRKFQRCLVALTCLSAATLLSGAETILADTFADAKTAGSPLQGRRLTSGPAVWEASPNLSVVKEGGRGFATATTPGLFIARVPVTATGKTVVVKGDLRAVPGTERGGWVAIGLGEPALNPVSLRWTGGIFVLLNPRGEYECHFSQPGDGTKLQLIRRGRIRDIDTEKPVPFVLRVDRESMTLDVEINGTAVIQAYELANLTGSISTAYAGFTGFEQKPGANLVSSFSVSVSR